MMNLLLFILATYGLTFTIRQVDGPWNIISKWRSWMMRLPLVGVQCYKLLDCPFCTGWWSSLAVYLLVWPYPKLMEAIVYGLAGAAGCLIIEAVLLRLWRE